MQITQNVSLKPKKDLSLTSKYRTLRENDTPPNFQDVFLVLKEFGMENTPLEGGSQYIPRPEFLIKPVNPYESVDVKQEQNVHIPEDDFRQNFGFEIPVDFTDVGNGCLNLFPPKSIAQQCHSDYGVLEILLLKIAWPSEKSFEPRNTEELHLFSKPIVDIDEVEQITKLLKFIADNQPFRSAESEKNASLLNKNTFKYEKLFQEFEKQGLDQNSCPDLKECYQLCFENNLIDQFCKQQYESDLSNMEFSKVVMNNQRISEILRGRIIKTSLYFIKICLEDLWSFVQTLKESSSISLQGCETVRRLTKDALLNIQNSILDYDKNYDQKIFGKELDECFKNVEKTLEKNPLDPQNCWIELLNCYYSYLNRLKFFFIYDISKSLDPKIAGFFQTLLRHPLSFLVSNKVLDVNWDLVHALLKFYQKGLEKFTEPVPPPQIQENIIAANLAFILDAELNGKRGKYFTSAPIGARRNDKVVFTEKERLHTLAKEIFETLENSMTSILSETDKIFEFEKIEVQLYFKEYDQVSANRISDAIDDGITRIVEKFQKIVVSSIEKTCFYTMKDKIQQISDDLFPKEISFFNYKFLELILYRKPHLIFAPITFYYIMPPFKQRESLMQKSPKKMQELFFTKEQKEDAKNKLISKLQEDEEFICSTLLLIDYDEITYLDLFKELISNPTEEKNKKWIDYFMNEKIEIWEDSEMRMIKKYFQDFGNV